jgi:hypothetical protein
MMVFSSKIKYPSILYLKIKYRTNGKMSLGFTYLKYLHGRPCSRLSLQ